MRIFARYHFAPLRQVKPAGWLRAYLERQREGLTGHLEVAGYPFDEPGWAAPVVESNDVSWGPYEQTAYWVDGALRCGYLLNDAFLLKKANHQIDYVLKRPDQDGYLGPKLLKTHGNQSRWPHTVLFRALMARYDATGDRRIVEALRRHYLSETADFWENRNITNLEIILWVYEHTGDEALLHLARGEYRKYNVALWHLEETVENMLSDVSPADHGVTYNELAKLAALMYKYTGEEVYLRAVENAYRKIDRDHMLIDGIHSSAENLCGNTALDSHETCDIADYTWSVGYLLEITGKVDYADKIERACFNAAQGAVRHDFKALQYFSCPNQVVAHENSNHAHFGHMFWMSYRPNPGTECCPGNVHRIMPNYVARMWLSDGQGGVAAALYGPSRYTFTPGNGKTEVTISEETDYPFSEEIAFTVDCAKAVAFPFSLRIPGWCDSATLSVNGRVQKRRLQAGTFVTLKRTFAPGDRIVLTLPMPLKLSHWDRGGIGIERGPLVYSLAIDERWEVIPGAPRSSKDFPAWNLYPASPWNYALAVDERTLDDIEVIRHAVTENPWTAETAPIELRVPARKVSGWGIRRADTVLRPLFKRTGIELVPVGLPKTAELTPELPDPQNLTKRLSKRVERISLVPYGCTHLRMTIFPQCRP